MMADILWTYGTWFGKLRVSVEQAMVYLFNIIKNLVLHFWQEKSYSKEKLHGKSYENKSGVYIHVFPDEKK